MATITNDIENQTNIEKQTNVENQTNIDFHHCYIITIYILCITVLITVFIYILFSILVLFKG
jgi:hypothetical protein